METEGLEKQAKWLKDELDRESRVSQVHTSNTVPGDLSGHFEGFACDLRAESEGLLVDPVR